MGVFHKLQAFAEIDIWLIVITTAYWVFSISEIPARVILGVIVGLASGLLYYFLIKKEEKIVKLKIFELSLEKLLAVLFIALLLTFLIPPINNIYLENWFAIPLTNWVKFILVNVFCTFLPGFILIKLVDRENKLPAKVCTVLSVVLSIFFTSLFWYFANVATLHCNLVNALFLTINFALILAYIHGKKKRKIGEACSPRMLDFGEAITLVTIAIFSEILVYIQQFVYLPFIRGDNWGYLSLSNYIDKGALRLKPVGKFYHILPPFTYSLYVSALSHLSGFPPVNSMMMTSLIVSSLIPIAFYSVSLKYANDKRLSMLSAFIYVAVSGFGWIPFLQEIGINMINRPFSPQDLLSKFNFIAPKVLNDITQPQGAMPEGFKAYELAILALLMLLYLLQSNLSFKVRSFFIATMTAFTYLAHIEEALIMLPTFLLAYTLSAKKRIREVREDIVAVGIGLIFTCIITSTYPNEWISSFMVNYIISGLVLGLFLGYTFVKKNIKLKLADRKLKLLKFVVLCLICYSYLLSVIILIFYGYGNMNYGSSVVYEGFTFPWYYYPLSFGIMGVLMLIGFSMNFQKEQNMIFFLLSVVLLLIFGRLVSFINVNFFFTGTKEWRILYRLVPIPATIFAGWTFYKLFNSLRSARLYLTFNKSHKYQFNLRRVSTFLFIFLVILGIPSTILSSEYWMITDSTDLGTIRVTAEDLEAANFIYQNIPMTSRMATLSTRSNAVIKLAGGTTATPSIYPDVLSFTRPETLALLSSDLGYLYLDKEFDLNSTSREIQALLTFMPLTFNNSKVLIYELPNLEPPTKSGVGYISPQIYTNQTLLSYIIIGSLNVPYNIVYDDIYDKSVLLLPSDIPRTQRFVLKFNGTNNYVDFGDILDIKTNNLTVEILFKTSVSGKYMSLVNKRRTGVAGTGYRIVIAGDTNRIIAEMNDGHGTVAAVGQAHNDGMWHHAVAVFDRDDKLKLYVDGKLEGEADISGKQGNIDTDCPLTLGSEAGGMFFEGCLSSFRIYNRTLSESEIYLNFADPDNPVADGLVAWLPLDEGMGKLVYDVSVNRNDGLIYGADWVVENVLLRSVYSIEPQKLISWVEGGGTIVVLGGSGMFYRLCGLQYGDYAKANEIFVENKVYSLNETFPLRILRTTDNMTRVLSYYSLDGIQSCPLTIQKIKGKGNVIYVYTDPITHMVSARPEKLSYIACIIKRSLENVGIRFPESSEFFAKFPLEKRWMGKYLAYGENSFIAEGDITVTSQLSGSYFVYQPFIADKLLIQSTKVEKYEKVIINRVEIFGFAELELRSRKLELYKGSSIPTYLPCKFENLTFNIKPLKGSKIDIETKDGHVFAFENEIVLEAQSAIFRIKDPNIYVNGSINFAEISLPDISDAWTKNVTLIGNLTFIMDYSDENYFFCEKIEGIYTVKVPSKYPKVEWDIPWQDIILSPLHIVSAICLIFTLRKTYNVIY